MQIGDKVYQHDNVGKIYTSTIINILKYPANCIYETNKICFDDRALGETIFTSVEEAKKHFSDLERKCLYPPVKPSTKENIGHAIDFINNSTWDGKAYADLPSQLEIDMSHILFIEEEREKQKCETP